MLSRLRILNRLNCGEIYFLNSNLNQQINLKRINQSNNELKGHDRIKVLIKKRSLTICKIKDQLEENDKLNEKAKSILTSVETIFDEIKELDELFENELENEMRILVEDDLANLDLKFSKLKDKLIAILYKESYLTDELTMEFENGVGGNEAMMFTKELVDFYAQFCRKQNWIVSQIETQFSNEVDGYLNCTLKIAGKDCFKLLRHEAGVHRVQRIPTNDKMNRMHTSTIAIKVIPIFNEIEIDLSPKSFQIDSMRSSGPGGQNVNKRESAIRITHLPTGIAIKCDDSKEQLENKKVAFDKLKLKLSEIKYKELKEKEDKIRSNQVKSLLRSDKIRTFNFAQDRITDHRIRKEMSNLKGFFSGGCNQNLSDWIEEMNDSYNCKLKEDLDKRFDD